MPSPIERHALLPDKPYATYREYLRAVGESAVELARSIFPRLSFDLIYARPGQTPELWAAELEGALARAADHLSLYQLTIEEGTPFFALHQAGKLLVPDEETAAALFDQHWSYGRGHAFLYKKYRTELPWGWRERRQVYGDLVASASRLMIAGFRYAAGRQSRDDLDFEYFELLRKLAIRMGFAHEAVRRSWIADGLGGA